MTIPLSEVPNRKEQLASKPGYIVDEYIRIQEINNAVDECKEDIRRELVGVLNDDFLKTTILNKIDKWLNVIVNYHHLNQK